MVPEAMQASSGDTFMVEQKPATPMMHTQASTRLWSLLRRSWISLLRSQPLPPPMSRATMLKKMGSRSWVMFRPPSPAVACTMAAHKMCIRDRCDIVPTLIELMGMEQPKEMTGKSLLVK